jgi:hypothetical protein
MFLIKLIKKLDDLKIPYALVGGHAVAFHGAVRGTLDIDLVIKWTLKNLKDLEMALKDLGLSSRLPLTYEEVFNFKDEYIKNRNLIAWNFINPDNPTEQVDIILTTDLSRKSVVSKKIGEIYAKVLSKKDLIEMKKQSGRKQDLIDIEALEKLK